MASDAFRDPGSMWAATLTVLEGCLSDAERRRLTRARNAVGAEPSLGPTAVCGAWWALQAQLTGPAHATSLRVLSMSNEDLAKVRRARREKRGNLKRR